MYKAVLICAREKKNICFVLYQEPDESPCMAIPDVVLLKLVVVVLDVVST